MSAEHKYFQFPLCCLAFGKTLRERTDTIISYCVINVGLKLCQALEDDPDDARHAWADAAMGRSSRADTPSDRVVILGAATLNVKVGGFERTYRQHDELEHHIHRFEQARGGSMLVRFRSDWLFAVRDSHMLSEREFGLLCAVYCSIGRKDYARVTSAVAARMALGYQTEDLMRVKMNERQDGQQLLTQRKVLYTLDRLHELQFFAKVTPGRRHTYFSNRLTRTELEERVFRAWTYRSDFAAAQRQARHSLQERIRAAKQAARAR